MPQRRQQTKQAAPGPETQPAREERAGARPTFFLRTKLLPPRLAPALLARPRLIERLLANLSSPVTLVAANAGSGKTTLVADFVRTHARRFVWYQLDHADADPLLFLGYLTEGIRQAVPGFGEITLAYLQQAAGELSQQPERAVDVLLNEVLDHVEQQLILVLDDYHHLGPETSVHRVVDRLLAYLPDVLHVIIISRDLPPLALARLRSQTPFAVIDRAELLFTDEETQALFRQVFDLELLPAQLAEYRERTHGWITALQLVRQVAGRQALSRGASAPDLVEVLRQSERDIFEYFAEEVFADETAEVQQFLLRVSLLDRLETEACTHLLPAANCAELLNALVRRNVFLTVVGDGHGEEYRLHPLFRSFLRRRLRGELGREGLAAEHARLAGYYLERGQWEQAMRHLLAAEEYERAAAVIAEQGGAWLASGAILSLASLAEAVPAPALEKHPRSLAHRAEAARLQGEYEAAQSLFRRASALLAAQGDREGEAETLHSLATIARRRGDFSQTFDYLDRAVALSDERSPVRIKCGNTRGLTLHAMGEWAAAEAEFRSALQAAEEQGDEHYARLIAHNLGLPAMVRGDFGEALRWLRRMFDEAGARRGRPPLPQEATALLNMARCHLYRGETRECEERLERALACGQQFNLVSLRGEIFETYGNLYRELNDAGRAAESYERAARAYTEAGADPLHYELYEEQALLRLQLNDLAGARALLDRLLEAREASGNQAGVETARLALGRVLFAGGAARAARAALEPALAYFRPHQLSYYEAQTCLALAACADSEGHEEETLGFLRRALDLAARYDYEYWLRREVAARPQLFSPTEARELLPPELREIVPENTPQPAAPAAPVRLETTKTSSDLTVNLLGPVEIFRDPARPLSADAWVTKRARDILCFIASRPHRRASKDTIIDTFWGEADFEAVEKNFHPTISHIRKALNSNQPLKQNFLLYRDGDYLLNPDYSYRFDMDEFDRLLREGAAARRAHETERYTALFAEAAELYRGDFMQNCYDDWVEEQRSYYREQYLRMLEALTLAAQKAADWPRAASLAQQILKADQFREDMHCTLMRAFAGMNNRAAVKEQFDLLRRLLRKELGVEPAAETQRVYRELMK